MKDVAKLAGVSVMTASRVINSSGPASRDATDKVWSAVKQLHYRPNLTARSLRMQRSRLLGVLVPDIENPIFAALAKYVEMAANQNGYNVMLGNTWENQDRESKYLDLMISRQMEGIIISPVSLASSKSLQKLRGVPIVMLDRSFDNEELPSVTMDNRMAGAMAAKHLADLGHSRFVCMTGRQQVSVFRERQEGFTAELKRRGFKPEIMNLEDIQTIDGFNAFEAISRRAGMPFALFTANDLTALGALQAAHKMGIRVPEEVSIMGVDDIPACDLVTPSLTSIRQPFMEIAATGVKLLIDIINGGQPQSTCLVLPPELSKRESTAAPGGK